jgi:NADPH-dependent 2,4-dienoyl-CoA reductase/sulfur reductase-like enzyme/rhodanese-related sulfurtransferase
MPKNIVVIGGAQGGPAAAARARGFDEHARIVLIEKNEDVSWIRADLRYHLEGRVSNLEELDRERQSFFNKRHRIEVRNGCEAVGIDVDARRVLVKTKDGTERVPFDSAIFAGGASEYWPDIEGLRGPALGVAGFRGLKDLERVKKAIEAGAKTAVVLGAGHNGIDAAQGLLAAGLDVQIVERQNRILPTLSLLAARYAARLLTRRGLRLRLGEEVERADERAGGGRVLHLKSGETLEADLVVVAIGVEPRTKLLAEAGAAVNPDGSVRVDSHMATTLPNVYACGTAVSVHHSVTGRHKWVPTASITSRTAQIAGRSAAVGRDEEKESLPPIAGTEVVEVGEYRFARTGLSDSEARSALGHDHIRTTTVHSWANESWLGTPEESDNELSVRLVVDTERDVVVGGEAWGARGVPRRIDLIAAAVLERWSPARLASIDVAYTPAIGPALDPLHAVGTVAALASKGEAWLLDPERFAFALGTGEPMTLLDVGRGDRGDMQLWPEGTVHIPLEDLRERSDELPKDRRIVALSHTGRRGHLAARMLRQRGFEDVVNLDGGAKSWSLIVDEQPS